MDEPIAPVASPTAPPNPTTPVNPNQNFLSSDSFPKILAAELQYQDPLEPQSNSEFVSQIASFSALDYQERIVEAQKASAQELATEKGRAMLKKHIKKRVNKETHTHITDVYWTEFAVQ